MANTADVSHYYQHYFKQKTALDESTILTGLSNSLQQQVRTFFGRNIIYYKSILEPTRKWVILYPAA